MPRSRVAYPLEFRQKLIELVGAGRSPEQLAKEFEPSAQTIRTTRDAEGQLCADLVQRQFNAEAPNRLWVADITYIPTWAGFLFLAVVLDAFSRKIVGWAMAEHLRTELVLAALNMALGQRRAKGVVHHSDHGTQYTSIAFGLRCKEAKVRPSMGTVGDAYDNAVCESFFATLERELLARRRFETKAQARMAIFEFIEGWYKPDSPSHETRPHLADRVRAASFNARRARGYPQARALGCV